MIGRDFAARRLGCIMQPLPGDPLETEGVLNPAVTRSPDGELYIFPRLVAEGNYSRIGIGRVQFDRAGDPASVERLGIALEPAEDFELHAGGGGCEDPRITFVRELQLYVMTYAAYGTKGPRVAAAVSADLLKWRRLGLLWFEPASDIDFNAAINKDAVVLPDVVLDPNGRPSVAILHRPIFRGTDALDIAKMPHQRRVDLYRESIWISYTSLEAARCNHALLCHFTIHERLMSPVSAWEALKIGAGTPPTAIGEHTSLAVYHGVSRAAEDGTAVIYSAGVILFDRQNPRNLRYRSASPVLSPETPEELAGAVPSVVFPTGIDRRDDIGMPHRVDVYYGMADYRIGVAALLVPSTLPSGGAPADASAAVMEPR